MNQDQSSLSEILFFGMRLKAGREEVYSIENEEGQMEICHLTNCALVSESTSRKPIYVRMKNPDVDSEFVIGALVPGQVYSFQTDLLITPDTSFSHSGGPQDEVHLTGYRTVNSESMFMGEDLDDSDDEMDEDDEEDEDDDFIVDDSKVTMESEGDSDDDEEGRDEEEEEEEDASEEEEEEKKGKVKGKESDARSSRDIRGKMDIKQEKEFAKLVKERSKAREKLQNMRDQGNELARPPDLIDMDIKALEETSMWGGPQDSDDEEDFAPPEDESVDDDEEVKRHMAELMEEDGEGSDDEDDDDEDASSGDEGEANDEEHSGSLLRTKRKNPSENGAAKKKAVKGSRRDEGDADEDDDADDDADEDADPSNRAKAVTVAKQQKEKIEREKQKQKLNGAKKTSADASDTPQEQSSKKRKASLGGADDQNSGEPAKKAAKGLVHPRNAGEATQQYAEAIHRALEAHGKPMTMALLSQRVKKPPTAEKMGKVVGKYDCFTRGDEGKGKDIVKLTSQ